MEDKKLMLDISNIGLIKKAKLDISGLTVIAGENDTGKSTIGKALMAAIKSDNMAKFKSIKKESKDLPQVRISEFNNLVGLIFDNQISSNGKILLLNESGTIYNIAIKNNKCQNFEIGQNNAFVFKDCVFIQTPLVWDLYDTFASISKYTSDSDIYGFEFSIKYPYLLWDLYRKLTSRKPNNGDSSKEIVETIGGKFKVDDLENYYYEKQINNLSARVELKNTPIGVKSFGILQILLDNNYVRSENLLIFDEPENHLHPKWQLKFAEVIVKIVKSGVKILVNSHSPYMIEALQRYSDKDKIIANFYLAENGEISKVAGSNEKTLSEIFKKLSEPFEVFEKMDIGD